MSQHDLSNEQRAIIELLIPKRTRKRGRPHKEDRQTFNGILYVLKAGCAWVDLPAKYGSDAPCWRHLKKLCCKMGPGNGSGTHY